MTMPNPRPWWRHFVVGVVTVTLSTAIVLATVWLVFEPFIREQAEIQIRSSAKEEIADLVRLRQTLHLIAIRLERVETIGTLQARQLGVMTRSIKRTERLMRKSLDMHAATPNL